MKIITHAKNFSLNTIQEDFINEKIKKISELAKTLNNEFNEINIDFEYSESKKKDDQISCVATLNLKWHKSIRVEKSSETVEKSFAEVKKVLLEDIKKIKWKSWKSSIHSRVYKKIQWFFWK